MSNHYVNVCEYGFVHGQCRCPSSNKTRLQVKCNTPDRHTGIEIAPALVGASPLPMVENPERLDQIWQFFKALNEGRVTLVQTGTSQRPGWRVSVSPPVQDPGHVDPNQQSIPTD